MKAPKVRDRFIRKLTKLIFGITVEYSYGFKLILFRTFGTHLYSYLEIIGLHPMLEYFAPLVLLLSKIIFITA